MLQLFIIIDLKMAASLFMDLDGMPILDSDVIGYGGSGVVVRRGNLAIKMPLRYPGSSEEDVQSNIKVLQHEQEVYRRFNSFTEDLIDRIVPCSRLCTNAIELGFMENGDLRSYLQKHQPSRTVQIAWFRQMARALEQIHGKYVLLCDIASRNILLDSDLSIKICDFSEASILPLGTTMETVNDQGFSVQTDIGLLGAVIYEVIAGQQCKFNLFDGPAASQATFPHRTSLPSTASLWLGHIIEKCWTVGGFQNAHALSQALESADLEQENHSTNKKCTTLLEYFRGETETSIIVLAITFSALIAVTTWVRRQT
ncbi:serine/threonine-protein kinase HT1, putative [Talaromyces stipitatus ATCC 10500]|uniref:Serine/threonine-protein kinase HT1, putative n=1 Tax=Talaromyces stipitatus (strain ATCC 10500 / CBS 375.48 / QM 6759 / NRRL 1006) TaxID=441959 RepID=B8MV31_TALSN|nr:serine/threonine-protein kinase HT1, putative [Talaromyces stipitatus ATCC 10500]EED11918.1 serine/threonine-protein kinase HT1, putative [Talaromyces stipitatus ATCC 10500]